MRRYRFVLRHLASRLVETTHHRRIAVKAVGRDRDHVLARAELENFGGFDGTDDIADGADAEKQSSAGYQL